MSTAPIQDLDLASAVSLLRSHTQPGSAADLVLTRLAELTTELAEYQAGFDMRWHADQRAIQRWQAAAPGRELRWPDHTDLCVWLMEQLESQSPPVEALSE